MFTRLLCSVHCVVCFIGVYSFFFLLYKCLLFFRQKCVWRVERQTEKILNLKEVELRSLLVTYKYALTKSTLQKNHFQLLPFWVHHRSQYSVQTP